MNLLFSFFWFLGGGGHSTPTLYSIYLHKSGIEETRLRGDHLTLSRCTIYYVYSPLVAFQREINSETINYLFIYFYKNKILESKQSKGCYIRLESDKLDSMTVLHS
uniref:Uncharacterized protein n=1 Tax=Opuntia streptacantha TaxID=393608 RepID=A0A7C8Z778_OPUST